MSLLRSDLGLATVSSSAKVQSTLGSTFPYVPDWLLGGGAATRFATEAAALALPGIDLSGTMPPRPPGSAQLASPGALGSIDDARTAARGLIRGKWDGLGGHW